MKADTLTRRLFFRIVPIIFIAIVVIGILSYKSAISETNETYDAQMGNSANLLWMLVEDEIHEYDAGISLEETPDIVDFIHDRLNVKKYLSVPQDFRDESSDHMFRIWRKGTLIMRSNTPFLRQTSPPNVGFSNVAYKKTKWRILAVSVPKEGVIIQVGENMDIRNDLISEIFLDLFTPLLLLTPILALLVWGGIRSGLDTIRDLVRRILQRSPDDLSPINIKNIPDDLNPLVQSINDLMKTLGESLSAERKFADYAAHQLRTPLAGLKLQLQLLAQADDNEDRQSMVDNLLLNVDRATRHVTQLLRAARITHTEVRIQAVSLYDVCASVIAGLGTSVMEKKMNVSLAGDEEETIQADKTLLRLLVENIFENALKYTPAGGDIHLNISHANGNCQLLVQDNGPGIAPEDRMNVFRRFYRSGAPLEEGSGIGLAIVSEVIRRFNGEISLETPETGRGLLVRIVLPAILKT